MKGKLLTSFFTQFSLSPLSSLSTPPPLSHVLPFIHYFSVSFPFILSSILSSEPAPTYLLDSPEKKMRGKLTSFLSGSLMCSLSSHSVSVTLLFLSQPIAPSLLFLSLSFSFPSYSFSLSHVLFCLLCHTLFLSIHHSLICSAVSFLPSPSLSPLSYTFSLPTTGLSLSCLTNCLSVSFSPSPCLDLYFLLCSQAISLLTHLHLHRL